MSLPSVFNVRTEFLSGSSIPFDDGNLPESIWGFATLPGVAAGLWRGLPSNQVLKRGVICLVLGARSVGIHLDKHNHGDTRHQLMQSWELALRGGESPREGTLWEGGQEQIMQGKVGIGV